MATSILNRTAQITGCLLGAAVGDAIGLPREGLSRRRARRLFGDPPLRHALVGRWGMCSDDTEHACLVAQALLASHGEPTRFARSLAWRLRGWLLGLPAGVGLATAKATLKLWLGFPPSRSGVWSAGNGPAMRAAILGAYAQDDLPLLLQLVRASTRITHSDPAAEHGALAVALAAAYGAREGPHGIRPDGYLALVGEHMPDTPMLALLSGTVAALKSGISFDDYLAGQGLDRGVSGYINHTVPAAIFCWLKWPSDYRAAIEHVVAAGGDTDTTAAITGGLVGATVATDAIPPEWLTGLIEWPRSVRWMTRLAHALSDEVASHRTAGRPVPLFWPALLLRNALFLMIVVAHALRRFLPPY